VLITTTLAALSLTCTTIAQADSVAHLTVVINSAQSLHSRQQALVQLVKQASTKESTTETLLHVLVNEIAVENYSLRILAATLLGQVGTGSDMEVLVAIAADCDDAYLTKVLEQSIKEIVNRGK